MRLIVIIFILFGLSSECVLPATAIGVVLSNTMSARGLGTNHKKVDDSKNKSSRINHPAKSPARPR
jgi:hypothetical protein